MNSTALWAIGCFYMGVMKSVHFNIAFSCTALYWLNNQPTKSKKTAAQIEVFILTFILNPTGNDSSLNTKDEWTKCSLNMSVDYIDSTSANLKTNSLY